MDSLTDGRQTNHLPLLSPTASSGKIATNQDSNNQHVKYHENLISKRKRLIQIKIAELFSHPQINPPLLLIIVMANEWRLMVRFGQE